MKVLKNARGMNALNPELCTHALRTRLHIQCLLFAITREQSRRLSEKNGSRAGCDFWRQWNMSRFGMQEKKLYAGGIRHSIRLLFSREQRAAGQRDMGVGLSPRPIVPC